MLKKKGKEKVGKAIAVPRRQITSFRGKINNLMSRSVFQPILRFIQNLQVIGTTRNLISRNTDTFIQKILDGTLIFKNNSFYGEFDDETRKAIRKLGGQFSKKRGAFSLNKKLIPNTLLKVIDTADYIRKKTREQTLNLLDNFLFNPADTFESNYNITLLHTSRSLLKSIPKSLSSKADLEPESWIKLRNKYTNTLRRTIKGFAKDEIEYLRQEIFKQGLTGIRAKSLEKIIQERFDISKSRANLIAYQELSNIHADYKQQKYKEMDITQYIWKTVGDNSVRTGHRRLNNKVFRFDTPPIVDRKSSRRANPGEDFRCRCEAEPIFISQK